MSELTGTNQVGVLQVSATNPEEFTDEDFARALANPRIRAALDRMAAEAIEKHKRGETREWPVNRDLGDEQP